MRALVFENKVVQLEETDFNVAPQMTWMDAPDGCEYGWILENGNLVAPPEPPEPTYDEKRRRAFPDWRAQLDQQYWDAVNGTTTWVDGVAEVKAANPKP